MVELAVSLTVLLILTAIAIPSLMRSFERTSARRGRALIRMLKSQRFRAVRLNKQVKFLMQTSGTGWVVGTDSNGNGLLMRLTNQQ